MTLEQQQQQQQQQQQRMASAPKWVNPCGYAADGPTAAEPGLSRLTDRQLLRQMILQAKTAMSHARRFRDDFVERTFNADFEGFHREWRGQRYDWLPSAAKIPKQLGERLSEEFLDQLALAAVLLDIYEYLQTFAVALEQVAWDQQDRGLEFADEFAHAELQLRALLCEIQVALLEKGIPSRSDVTRDVMPAEIRTLSDSRTHMNLRDWLIFRDYMNGLEFVVEVLEHLLAKLERREEL